MGESGFKTSKVFTVYISLDKECRKQNPVIEEAKVKALVYENYSEGDVVIFTHRGLLFGTCATHGHMP